MKFEKLSSLKFEAFKAHSIENANAIVGGVYETDGKGTHDTCETYKNGTADGAILTSNDGTSIKDDK
jgi:hypothetical protein